MSLSAGDPKSEPLRTADLFGHPRGLSVLFATEMWERFSYFGMSSLLVLYMTKYLFVAPRPEAVIGYGVITGALQWLFGHLERQPLASLIYGLYTGLAYLTPILGGLIADRVLGQRRTVILGGVLMAIGHFMMTSQALFFAALATLILGVGTFKPNISTQVGGLYGAADTRRLRAYAIFYVGINVGAFLAPLVCGTLGEQVGWHYGFGAAGAGMLVALGVYLYGWRTLPTDQQTGRPADSKPHQPFEAQERRSVLALLLLCVPVALFWATYDLQGNTIVLWASEYTDRSIAIFNWHVTIPTTWFLALNPLMIFAFTPVLVRVWGRVAQIERMPSTVNQMALGFLGVVLANLTLALAAWNGARAGGHSPAWLVVYFSLVTIGELHLAPVGLALISQVAPARSLSLMMGIWFATTFPGDLIGGWLGSFWADMPKARFFLMIAGVAALGGIATQALNSILTAGFNASARAKT
jgi:POT family proton-dependent oligopeptide transporter